MEELDNKRLEDINRAIGEDPGPPSSATFFLPKRKAYVLDAMNIRIGTAAGSEYVAGSDQSDQSTSA